MAKNAIKTLIFQTKGLEMKYIFFLTIQFLTSITFAQKHIKIESTKLNLEPYGSRVILNTINDGKSHPLVILIPGAGAQGPEEMVPAHLTKNSQDISLFSQLTEVFNRSGINTISLGKPGVDFFSDWSDEKRFYNKNLYDLLKWQDLIENVKAAFNFSMHLTSVDKNRIYILGHSEGAQVAADFIFSDHRPRGLILLSYFGSSVAKLTEWQLYRRKLENFIATDVDGNWDGVIDQHEDKRWEDFFWNWGEDKKYILLSEVQKAIKNNSDLIDYYDMLKNLPIYSKGVFNRSEIHFRLANLPHEIYVFNGDLDMQVPVTEAYKLMRACEKTKKQNCVVNILRGVGHGFSRPRPPRAHPFLDSTLGPIESDLLEKIKIFADNI